MSISFSIRTVAAIVVIAAATLMVAGVARAADYVPGEVVVGYTAAPPTGLQADVARLVHARLQGSVQAQAQLLKLAPGEDVASAVARLRRQPGVAYAVPNYVAHLAGTFIPNDVGRGRVRTEWRLVQWNFLGNNDNGVHAPVAWTHLIADHAPGGRGVTVAILDTGVAYRNWTDPHTRQFFARSPDFAGTRFRAPCDLISGGFLGKPQATITSRTRCAVPQALDRNGHGTFVAGVVAEATNNRTGVTGLAYGAAIMPVRVLDADGNGDATTIARGIRYAATHGARVVNLSLEFDLTVGPSDIPQVMGAITFARKRGVVVVAAAGNDEPQSGASELAYPARDPQVVSVGATTRDGCVAAYSNTGPGLTMVAPGGGNDAYLTGNPRCHPGRALPDVYQMTLLDPSSFTRFGLPSGWYGTSMASPHVAAAAALVMASGVLGAHPSVGQVITRLERTATHLGPGPFPNQTYGYGLLNAGAATAGRSLIHRPRPKKH